MGHQTNGSTLVKVKCGLHLEYIGLYDKASLILFQKSARQRKDPEPYWVKPLGLRKENEKILRSGQWLNSNIINATVRLV